MKGNQLKNFSVRAYIYFKKPIQWPIIVYMRTIKLLGADLFATYTEFVMDEEQSRRRAGAKESVKENYRRK